MPDVLHPDVRAGRKEQPMHGYEEQTHQIRCYCNAHKEHGKCLEQQVRERVQSSELLQIKSLI